MLTNCSAPYCRPFRVSADLLEYLHTPRTRSTKPFAKRLSRCRDKWTCIFMFSASCSPTAQTLTMVRFAWSWARSDTFLLRENAPQNRLRNCWAVVAVRELLYSVFCLRLTNYSVTYHGPSCVILDSFIYPLTPWKRSTKPFTKRLSRCSCKGIFIFGFLPYTHQLLSHLPWSVLCDLGLVQLPSYSVKTLHKTIYKMVELL